MSLKVTINIMRIKRGTEKARKCKGEREREKERERERDRVSQKDHERSRKERLSKNDSE